MYENHPEVKVYICLYTRATSRAIHLEIVNDLTVDMFLLSFRRFTRRRSLSCVLMSDNVSTSEELQELHLSLTV